MAELDMDGRYAVAGYRGVAFYLRGYSTEQIQSDPELICEDPDCAHEEWICWTEHEPEVIENRGMVRAVMVGDDREHLVDVDDLTPIGEDDYCPGCGQIGCHCYG